MLHQISSTVAPACWPCTNHVNTPLKKIIIDQYFIRKTANIAEKWHSAQQGTSQWDSAYQGTINFEVEQ
jgi:hypothetical protein